MKKKSKKSKNSNLPEEVELYVETIKSLIYNDSESYNDMFGNKEWIDEDIYWSLFEAKVMFNWANDNDPSLSPEQFKSIHIETAKITVEKSLQSLVGLGLIEQTENGFFATEKGVETIKIKEGKNKD